MMPTTSPGATSKFTLRSAQNQFLRRARQIRDGFAQGRRSGGAALSEPVFFTQIFDPDNRLHFINGGCDKSPGYVVEVKLRRMISSICAARFANVWSRK